MQILVAVFRDLWNYFFGRFLRFGDQRSVEKKANTTKKVVFEQPLVVKESKKDNQHNNNLTDNSLEIRNVLVGEEAFVSVARALLWKSTAMDFDTVLCTLDYGQKVTIFGQFDKFVKVEVFGNRSGYLEKSAITLDKVRIFPVLNTGSCYSFDSDVVRQVRLLLKDDFFASKLNLPLQPEEFIQYRLERDGRFLPWGSDRPRLAGFWHLLLKGKVGVRIGVEPKTASVLEYARKDTSGVLAYVKSVHGDNSITLESVGKQKEGQYLQEVLSKYEWQKHRPVFIQVA